MSEVGIVRGDFGKGYQFVIKNVDYSSHGGLMYVQSPSGTTMLIDGGACTTDPTDGAQNTLVTYVPVSGDFGFVASYYKYECRIRFSGAAFRDSTEMFYWQVHREKW